MPRYLPTDIGNLLVTQMALFVTLLTGYIDVTDWRRVEIILDQLSETFNDVFESTACDKKMVLVFRVKECAQSR